MNSIYSKTFEELAKASSAPLRTVENENDLYWEMALSLYQEIKENNAAGKKTVCIMPVGPVFQYRRFIRLLEIESLSLENLSIFFMDEYLEDGTDHWISDDSPLSFHGFIKRELLDPMPSRFGLRKENIHFPDPSDPGLYDKMISDIGGIDLCHAGVGITGHLAFNEPISNSEISCDDFTQLGTRILDLTPQTITINSNTALRGAWEEIPRRAITIGFKQIFEARKLNVYMNREWQSSVLRKALLLDPTPEFPVTLLRNRNNVSFTVTPVVAKQPEFALK
ncbi:MAG: hypothetical protein WC117_03395 [Sphaerochaetaceae bacterium]|jgi:glucosamine-6-phosphate deaminase